MPPTTERNVGAAGDVIPERSSDDGSVSPPPREITPSLEAEIASVVLDVEPCSCTVRIQSGQVTVQQTYLLDGRNLNFLAGKVMWARGSKAGLFFKHPLQAQALECLRRGISSGVDHGREPNVIILRCVD